MKKTGYLFYLFVLIFGVSCGGSGGVFPPCSDSVVSVKPHRLHVFIDNSGSMKGYINPESDFKSVIYNIVEDVKLDLDSGDVKLYYVNNSITPFKDKDEGYWIDEMLDEDQFSKATTDLNRIIKQVLDSVNSTDVAVLISDMIYSVAYSGRNTEVTKSKLNECQDRTKFTLLSKAKQMPDNNLALNFVKFVTYFDGNYYTYNKPNDGTRIKCDNRPYYLCAFGTKENLMYFDSLMKPEKRKGYVDRLVMIVSNDTTVNYDVLPATGPATGDFVHNEPYTIESIINKYKSDTSTFDFQIGIDLHHICLPDTYKADSLNYDIVVGDNKGKLAIKEVKPFDESKMDETMRKAHYSHSICVSHAGNADNMNDFEVRFKLQPDIGKWVGQEYSSDDDCNIKSDNDEKSKTFGLSYLVRGIFDAYEHQNTKNNYITIKISVKNE